VLVETAAPAAVRASNIPPSNPALGIVLSCPVGCAVASTFTKRFPAVWICAWTEPRIVVAAIVRVIPRRIVKFFLTREFMRSAFCFIFLLVWTDEYLSGEKKPAQEFYFSQGIL
jgi:hypothetical protein